MDRGGVAVGSVGGLRGAPANPQKSHAMVIAASKPSNGSRLDNSKRPGTNEADAAGNGSSATLVPSVRIPTASDEIVEIFSDEFPVGSGDYNDLLDLLRGELAPLNIWRHCAVSYSLVGIGSIR
jgi:hypothetical protein